MTDKSKLLLAPADRAVRSAVPLTLIHWMVAQHHGHPPPEDEVRELIEMVEGAGYVVGGYLQ